MKEIVIPMPTALNDKLTDRIKRRAAEHFGGFTVLEGQGGWLNPNGVRVDEPVDILTTVVGEENDTSAEAFAKATAKHLAAESDETEVMWYVREITAWGFEE